MRIHFRTNGCTDPSEYFIKTVIKIENNSVFKYYLFIDDYSQSYYFKFTNPFSFKTEEVNCGSFCTDYMGEIDYVHKNIIKILKK